jgi:hypothetical protein
MAHKLVKAMIIAEVVKLIAEKNSLSQDEALDLFYKSKTAINLCDDETGLYGQSALYIFSVFEDETKIGNSRKKIRRGQK